MRKLYSVRIIYRAEETSLAVYLKEFWMLCGVYVREYVIDMDHVELVPQKVDLNIIISGDNPEQEKLQATYDMKIYLQNVSNKDLSEKTSRDEFGKKIKECIEEERFAEVFDNLAEIVKLLDLFIRNDYAIKNYWGHVLQSEMSERDLLDLQEMYIECMNSLWPSMESKKEQYVQYAYINCARKFEQICRTKNERGYFSTRKLMEKAAEIKSIDPFFSSADALAGIIGLNDNITWMEGERYIQTAIHAERIQRHAGFLYYILAHFYEYQRRDVTKAEDEYQKMYQIVPYNYRVLYKVGCEKIKQHKKDEACQYFVWIFNEMYKKAESGYIQPLEIQYYYKCTKILIRIGENAMGKVFQALTEENLNSIRKETYSKSIFIKNFVEEKDIEKYEKLLELKMERY